MNQIIVRSKSSLAASINLPRIFGRAPSAERCRFVASDDRDRRRMRILSESFASLLFFLFRESERSRVSGVKIIASGCAHARRSMALDYKPAGRAIKTGRMKVLRIVSGRIIKPVTVPRFRCLRHGQVRRR